MIDIKYVVGLGTGNMNSLEEIENFCKINKDKLAFCYIHAPFGMLYADREELDYSFSEQNIQFIKNTTAIYKKYNIPIQVTFNSVTFKHQNIPASIILADMQKYIDIFGKPDYFITYDSYAFLAKEQFPDIKLARTVNSARLLNTNNIGCYDILVFRGAELYDFELLQRIKTLYPNIEMEYLTTDNTCVPTCQKDCMNCKELFLSTTNHIGINIMMAMQVVTNIELQLFIKNNYINYFKIPPKAVKNLNLSLDIQFSDTKKYFKDTIFNDLQELNEKYHFDSTLFNEWQNIIDIDLILNIKNKLWSKSGIEVDFTKLIK